MELVKFFLPAGIALCAWIVISQLLAQLIAYDKSDNGILSMWFCVFLVPILLLYFVGSWAYMKIRVALYNNIRVVTFGVAPMHKPSEDLRDYLP